MRKLANVCDIGLGTIYNYYPAKKDLVIAIMVKDWSQCILGIEKELDINENIFDCITNVYTALKSFFGASLSIWLQVNMILRIQDMHHYSDMRLKFISIINNLLSAQIENSRIILAKNIELDEFSKWLAENLITISHSSQVNFTTFKNIVSCVINRNNFV